MTGPSISDVVRVPKASEMIAARLRRQIIVGEIPEGAILPPEAALMLQFGVSRPTLREAFRILESESIIVMVKGAHGGARVCAPNGAVAARYTGVLLQHSGALLADVYSSRTVLEVSAVGMLAARRGTAHVHELRTLVEHGAELADDGNNFAEHDALFHQTVVRLAGNETFSVLIGMLYYIIDAHNQLYIANHRLAKGDPEALTAQRAHVRLLELLEAHDGEGAQTFWRHHLDIVAEYMVTDPATTVVEVLS